MDIEAVVDAALRGDPVAGPALISTFAPALVGYARMLSPRLGDVDLEVVCEDAVGRAVKKIHLFDPERGTLASWLRGFVRVTLQERLRTRPPASSIDAAAIPMREVIRNDVDDDEGASVSIREAVERVIAKLSPTDQLILSMRAVEGLSHDAIADRLGASVGACRVRYFRAAARFRDLAQGEMALHHLTEASRNG